MEGRDSNAPRVGDATILEREEDQHFLSTSPPSFAYIDVVMDRSAEQQTMERE
jgi:hypothetical protein